MEEIEIFVNKLIEEKQLGETDPDVLNEIKMDLRSRVEDRINTTIINELPDEAVSAFEQLLDAKETDETIQKFVSSHIENLDEKIAQALIAFRSTYLN
jgi:hypothetical protein